MVSSNCPKFHFLTLNEEIRFDLQNVVLKATVAAVDIANSCLEADNENQTDSFEGCGCEENRCYYNIK